MYQEATAERKGTRACLNGFTVDCDLKPRAHRPSQLATLTSLAASCAKQHWHPLDHFNLHARAWSRYEVNGIAHISATPTEADGSALHGREHTNAFRLQQEGGHIAQLLARARNCQHAIRAQKRRTRHMLSSVRKAVFTFSLLISVIFRIT